MFNKIAILCLTKEKQEKSMKTSVVGFPRVGAMRELKFASEKYFRGEIAREELETCARDLRRRHIRDQLDAGIDFVPCNDFSFYDGVLDMAVLLNAVPARYRELGLPALDTYFAMARGYQGKAGDVRALAMKKWFNTNYHYIVPEIGDDTEIRLNGNKPAAEFLEAEAVRKEAGSDSCLKPVLVGPFTFLKLARFTGQKKAADFAADVCAVYAQILSALAGHGARWIQLDEPSLVMDLTEADKDLFLSLYRKLLAEKGGVKILLQTYFGDIRDCYRDVCALGFDGIGLDFLEGKQTADLVAGGFPAGTALFAGLVNGKNIWRNDYEKTLTAVEGLRAGTDTLVLGTSCSLLHVPYTLKNETKMPEDRKAYFAFDFEFVQTAFAAAVAKKFPFFGGHFFQLLFFPEFRFNVVQTVKSGLRVETVFNNVIIFIHKSSRSRI